MLPELPVRHGIKLSSPNVATSLISIFFVLLPSLSHTSPWPLPVCPGIISQINSSTQILLSGCNLGVTQIKWYIHYLICLLPYLFYSLGIWNLHNIRALPFPAILSITTKRFSHSSQAISLQAYLGDTAGSVPDLKKASQIDFCCCCFLGHKKWHTDCFFLSWTIDAVS